MCRSLLFLILLACTPLVSAQSVLGYLAHVEPSPTLTHTVPVPSGVGGTLVMCICTRGQDPDETSWPAGWIEFFGDGDGEFSGNRKVVCAAKADAGETDVAITTTLTRQSVTGAWRVDSIDLGILTDVERQIGEDFNPDAPNIIVTDGPKNVVSIVAAVIRLTGGNCTDGPVGHTFFTDSTGGGGSSVTGCFSHQELPSTSSHDPTPFTSPIEERWNAVNFMGHLISAGPPSIVIHRRRHGY